MRISDWSSDVCSSDLIHGGIVHGIGNALFEFMRYDENAQPLTTTYADYLLPTSTEVPNLELIITESDTPTNPLGVKGVGEVGVVPVTSAIRSEERGVGKECVSTCRSWWSP